MIIFNNVSKSYATKKGRKYVLRDADLTIQLHEKVGVVGKNGAGKSTLMRLLAGVDVPDRGTITRSGSISWPMGLASGLQSVLTGRENTKFACNIQGVSRAQTKHIMLFVRKFSQIGDYFEMPVRTYSSGMRARLNFAIAMAFDFDFYIIDELTSVGDKTFRDRSRKVFEEKRGKAGFIKVSHNLGELKRECDSGLLLHEGSLTYYPDIDDALSAYKKLVGNSGKNNKGKGNAKNKATASNPEAAKRKAARIAKRKAAEAASAENQAIASTDATDNSSNSKAPATQMPTTAGQQPKLLPRGPNGTSQQPAAAPRPVAVPRPHQPAPMMPRIAQKTPPDA